MEHTSFLPFLFVDLEKAFDNAHHGLIYAVMKRLGLPPEHIRLLRNLNAARRTRVKINGELSGPIPCEKGAPQGDPPSPKIFNTIIQALSKKLNDAALLLGIKFIGEGTTGEEAIVRHLLYADDLVVICTSRAEVVIAADVIDEWGSEWGFSIGTGPGKTNALFMPRDHSGSISDVPLAPPSDPRNIITATNQLVIPWTPEYTYLGLVVDQRLGFHHSPLPKDAPPKNTHHVVISGGTEKSILRRCYTAQRNLSDIKRLGSTLMKPDSLIQSLSPKTKLQLINNGSCNFAASVRPPDINVSAAIDAEKRKLFKTALRLPTSFPGAIVMAEAAAGFTEMDMCTQRERFADSLSSPGLPGIARNVLSCTSHFLSINGKAPVTTYAGPRFCQPWASSLQESRDAATLSGIHPLSSIPVHVGPIQTRLATFARAGNYSMLHALSKPSREGQQMYTPTASMVNSSLGRSVRAARRSGETPFVYSGSLSPHYDARARPDPRTPSSFFFDLLFRLHADPLEVVPQTRVLKDFLFYGAKGTSIVASSTISSPNINWLCFAKLGAQSLLRAPFMPKSPAPPAYTAAASDALELDLEDEAPALEDAPPPPPPPPSTAAGAKKKAATQHAPLTELCRFCAGSSNEDGSPHISRDPLGQQHADIYHLLSGCTTGSPAPDSIRQDHALAIARRSIAASAVDLIFRISDLYTSLASSLLDKDERAEVKQLASRLRHWAWATIPREGRPGPGGLGRYWDDSADGRFLIFRLVIGCQFKTIHLQDATGSQLADMPISSAFASLFEYTPLQASHITPLANMWARWSVKQLKKLGSCWISAKEPLVYDGPEPSWDAEGVWAATIHSCSPRHRKDGPTPPTVVALFQPAADPSHEDISSIWEDSDD